MQVVDRVRRIEKSEGIQGSKFRITASAKAFKILSSGLYSNKHKAIIRELSTNAYDSHVEAGHPDKPFDVFLPSYDNLKLYIRDYGTGISPEKINDVYIEYFNSDKTNSNAFVGCLGLGSKSPFAYSDSFLVTSYVNGIAYTYTCFLDEEGCPDISLLSEDPTTEENGLKVELVVRYSDVGTFEQEAINVYKWFKVKPNFVNGDIEIPEVEFKSTLPKEDGKWGFINEKESYALMGNVAYPIRNLPSNALTHKHIQLLNKGLLLNFNIGELDIEASREGLSYDKRTIVHIQVKCTEIIDKITKMVENHIINANTMWEAACAFNSYNAYKLGDIVDLHKIQYKGKQLEYRFPLSKDCFVEFFEPRVNRNYQPTVSSCHHTVISASYSPELWLNDLEKGKGGIERIRTYIREKKRNGDHITAYLLDNDDKLDDILLKLGVDKSFLKLTSTLPKRVITRTVTKGDKSAVLMFNGWMHNNALSWVADPNLDITKPNVYVIIKKFIATVNGKDQSRRDISYILDYLKSLGPSFNLYGIKSHKSEKFLKANPHWVSLEDYAKKNITPPITELKNQYLSGIISQIDINSLTYRTTSWELVKNHVSKPIHQIISDAFAIVKKHNKTYDYRKIDNYNRLS